ncbi:MAG: ATPase, T2SS/T4P/T4SS family [Candidatus Marinimicrobia bacterium]|nr:ATPase, T2SS/T4P/T4SS family [Candidatus Neomarinimicrobiota bacterium]
MPSVKERKPLGQLFVENRKITQEQLNEALRYKNEKGIYFGKALLELNYITEHELAQFLAAQMDIPFVKLDDLTIDKEIIRLIPEDMAREYQVIPLFKIGDQLTIATADPLNVEIIDIITKQTGMDLDLVLATESDIQYAVDVYYGKSKKIEGLSEENIEYEVEDIEKKREAAREEEITGNTQVIEAVNTMLLQAIDMGVSDIHFEPREKDVRIRFRLDGTLFENYTLPKAFQASVASRLKIMCNMDIAETRKPQDGRIRFKKDNKRVSLRVSTYPTYFGEKIVMRVLDKEKNQVELSNLGFTQDVLQKWQELIHLPNGIILVTGPTGSGKTTTLYSTLTTLNTVSKNIITVEDPIEYELDNINQGQVNPKIGVTFSSALRTILRQDPDIMMIGELRDQETVELAIRSALTGHLVLSTLHTNDAPSAITRMIDMGVEPYLISSTLRAVLAQRLIRKLCPHCKERFTPPLKVLEKFNLDPTKTYTFYKPVGCIQCRNTGYLGRLGLFELLTNDEKMSEMIVSGATLNQLRKYAISQGMVQLMYQGIQLAKEGIVSIEEVLEITSMV